MEAVLKVLIIGATVAVAMYFAYLSTKVKAAAGRDQRQEDDSPGREEFDALRAQVNELAERVDFAERLLAQQREVPRVNQPKE